MSGSQLPAAAPPKSMSSRLMTMKFMQRAAASASPSSPRDQEKQAIDTPDTDAHPSKRRKTDSGAPVATTTSISDKQEVGSALDAEDNKRELAIERLAEEAGETKWVLSTFPENGGDATDASTRANLRVVNVIYSDIDSEAQPGMTGRKSYRKFNKDVERRQNGTAHGECSSRSESSGAETESDSDRVNGIGAHDLIRASREEAIQRAKAKRKAQRRAEKAEVARLAEKRKKKEVKLNRLSSISGTGEGNVPGHMSKSDRECFLCGKPGHEKRKCPSKGKQGFDDGIS